MITAPRPVNIDFERVKKGSVIKVKKPVEIKETV